MEKAQLDVIVGLVAGMQTAFVQLCAVLNAKGVAEPAEIAQALRLASSVIPADLTDRPIRQLVLNQIALALENPQSASTQPDQIRSLLH